MDESILKSDLNKKTTKYNNLILLISKNIKIQIK
jgi:hypothetical protein